MSLPEGCQAVLVSVEYDDLLAITLHRNCHHFRRIIVVTAPQDKRTPRVVAKVPNAELLVTDVFYQGDVSFNKGAALELGLEQTGRQGWIVVMDADIVLPSAIPDFAYDEQKLHGPRRRMLREIELFNSEYDWTQSPVFPDQEFAGYFQLFNSNSISLRKKPWYSSKWRHAGGCDSDFHRKWTDATRVRLEFQVLHLGLEGHNWCGRSTQRTDGTVPEESADRRRQLHEFITRRQKWLGDRQHNHEKLT